MHFNYSGFYNNLFTIQFVIVRKIRIIPKKTFQKYSLRSLYVNMKKAEYIQALSEKMKKKINSLKTTTFLCPQEGMI